MRLLVVVAAGFALALLWSLYEGNRAHGLDAPTSVSPPAVQIAPVLPAPVANAVKPVANATGPVTKPVNKVATPVANNVTKPLTPTVQPVVDALNPIVQPVVDTVAPIVRPAVDIVAPHLPAPPLPPVFGGQRIAPHGRPGSSATAVAKVVATAVAQVAGDATGGLARRFTSAVDAALASLPHPNLSMPVLPLPAVPVSFPSPVPLSHAPGGVGRTSGGGLAVLLAAAAVASLRGRRVRFATGVGQSLYLASLIERPG